MIFVEEHLGFTIWFCVGNDDDGNKGVTVTFADKLESLMFIVVNVVNEFAGLDLIATIVTDVDIDTLFKALVLDSDAIIL